MEGLSSHHRFAPVYKYGYIFIIHFTDSDEEKLIKCFNYTKLWISNSHLYIFAAKSHCLLTVIYLFIFYRNKPKGKEINFPFECTNTSKYAIQE